VVPHARGLEQRHHPVAGFDELTTQLVVGFRAAHEVRDEDLFTDPDVFDIDRKPNNHMAFGFSAHTCVGNTSRRWSCGWAVWSFRQTRLRCALGGLSQ
jgi:hypothetical protein